MKVLVACEESQRVCTAFRELGHEAYSCDIQECSGGHPEWHILGDVLPLINGNCEFITMDGTKHTIDGKWDLLIAHPPCTYLSNAGAARLFPKKGLMDVSRYKKGLEAKNFFMRFYNADCDKICIENPVPTRIYELPKYSQIIQPFEHGHPYSKKTCLWLKNLPKLFPTEIITENIISWVSGGSKDFHGNQRKQSGTKIRDSKQKSKTFPGIARAMAEQWGGQEKSIPIIKLTDTDGIESNLDINAVAEVISNNGSGAYIHLITGEKISVRETGLNVMQKIVNARFGICQNH